MLESRFEAAVRREGVRNARYRWLGAVSHRRARALIAQADVLVVTSRSEGGANVIGEAIVAGTPVLSSDIPGSSGILGRDYPGFYPVGSTAALRALLLRVESDRRFLRELARRCRALAPLFAPERERDAWRRLLDEVRAARRAGRGHDRAAPRRRVPRR